MSLALVPMIARPPQLGTFETDVIPSISDMDAAIADLQTKASEFGSETFNAELPGDIDGGWLMSWNKFVQDLADLKDELWINRWQRRSDILAMRQRFNDLVAWWHRIPGAPAATSTPTFDQKQISPPGNFDNAIKWAAIGLLAVAGIAVVAQLSPAIRALLPSKGEK